MALRQEPKGLRSEVTPPLRRSDPGGMGIRRRRRGRGFSYLGPDAAVITDPRTLDRVRSLVIPPAWENVWICADPRGHIQAIGTDAAGRRQYRYHDQWREQQDRDKHDRVLEFGAALPRIREVIGHRSGGPGPDQGKGPGGRDTPDRSGLLPLGRRRVRRTERHLRPGHDHEGSCHAGQRTTRLRVPGQGCQAARAGGRRGPGVRRRAEPATPSPGRRPVAGVPGRVALA